MNSLLSLTLLFATVAAVAGSPIAGHGPLPGLDRSQPPVCGDKEMLFPCGACDASCSEAEPICAKMCRPASCGCIQDHVRESKGSSCIHKSLCPGGKPVDVHPPPAEIRQPPAEIPQPPVDTRHLPVDIGDLPADIRQQPVDMHEKPVDVHQPPAEIRQPPADIRHQPVDVDHSPVDIRQPPAEIRQPPAEIRQPPADMRHQPVDVDHPPADIRQPPAEIRQPPVDTRHLPVDIGHPPVDIRQPLADIHQPLADIHQPSSGMHPSRCADKETWFPCGACDGSCFEFQPICSKMCQPGGGCGCMKDHVREPKGHSCIHKRDCPMFMPVFPPSHTD